MTSKAPVQPVPSPIICNPYAEPRDHWIYDRESGRAQKAGTRRLAAYWYKTEKVGTAQQGLDAGAVRVLNGKGGRSRTVGLDPGAAAVVRTWLAVRASEGVGEGFPLLCTWDGGRVSESYVRVLMARLRGKAGIAKRVHAHGLRLTVAPSPDAPDRFDLTPGAHVGAVWLDGLEVQIQPKLPIERLLFLVSYAVNPGAWRDVCMGFQATDSLVEAIAAPFVKLVARATYRGLLHGYRSEEDSLLTVRGQIRFADQIRDRFGIAPPIEVRFDDFTPDILENQLLRAALHRLSRMRFRSTPLMRSLREVEAAFHEVSIPYFDPNRLPPVAFTRLNQHYEPAVLLARLILQAASFDLGFGTARGTAFLLNMNEVFEAFVHKGLQETLGLLDREFPRGDGRLRLDEASQIRLEPDLSWWEGGRCLFVGDAKYKRLDVAGFKHADVYQMLAYTTAAHVSWGLLVYAAEETPSAVHTVRFAKKQIQVRALDLRSTSLGKRSSASLTRRPALYIRAISARFRTGTGLSPPQAAMSRRISSSVRISGGRRRPRPWREAGGRGARVFPGATRRCCARVFTGVR